MSLWNIYVHYLSLTEISLWLGGPRRTQVLGRAGQGKALRGRRGRGEMSLWTIHMIIYTYNSVTYTEEDQWRGRTSH